MEHKLADKLTYHVCIQSQHNKPTACHHGQAPCVADLPQRCIGSLDEANAQHQPATAQLQQQVDAINHCTAQKAYANHKDTDLQSSNGGKLSQGAGGCCVGHPPWTPQASRRSAELLHSCSVRNLQHTIGGESIVSQRVWPVSRVPYRVRC